jgi:hypothetical protein
VEEVEKIIDHIPRMKKVDRDLITLRKVRVRKKMGLIRSTKMEERGEEIKEKTGLSMNMMKIHFTISTIMDRGQ